MGKAQRTQAGDTALIISLRVQPRSKNASLAGVHARSRRVERNPSNEGHARGALTVAVEIASIIGAVSFGFSLLMHEIAFEIAGLSYVQFASLEDIGLGGLQVFVLMMSTMPFAIAVSIAFGCVMMAAWSSLNMTSIWKSYLSLLLIMTGWFAIFSLLIKTIVWPVVSIMLSGLVWIPPTFMWIIFSEYDNSIAFTQNMRLSLSSYGRMVRRDRIFFILATGVIPLALAIMIETIRLTDEVKKWR